VLAPGIQDLTLLDVPFRQTDGTAYFAEIVVSRDTSIGGDDTIHAGGGDNVVLGGAGKDDITATSGNNVILGDSGQVIFGAGQLLTVTSTNNVIGADDELTGGTGDDIIFGGAGSDVIHGGDGRNVVLGDNGSAAFNAAGQILTVTTTSAVNGGADNITTGTGDDVVFGGSANDTISASNGKNVVAGDNARATFDVNGQIRTIDTIDPAIGGNDTITTGINDDIILGGTANDTITTTGGNNVILGDNGSATINGSGVLQTVAATDPTIGGADTLTSGAGNDLIIAGTGNDTVSSGAGNDLIFGDHGQVTGNVNLTQLPLDTYTPLFTFTSIATQNSDLGGDDLINAEAGDDIIIGGQGFDRILGGSGDDDIIGGHTVADGQDTGDWIDGGSGNDDIAGDNADIHREPRTTDTRFRTLAGSEVLGTDGNGVVTATTQLDPSSTAKRTVTLFNHTATTAAGLYGNDAIAGGSGNDTIFGQLGNDAIQGDGTVINLSGAMLYDIAVTHMSTDDIDGVGTDGDDYIEGGGGNDTILGNLGQDDIIGGSSNLFGTPTAAHRPDGSDIIYGGSGTHAGRNELGDESINGHARDADVILGDNGNIFRIVGINGIASGNYLTFNYDTYGSQHIIPRTTQYLEYAFGDANNNAFSDEIHGESGDDIIHGMSGNDVLFGDGQDDDIIGGAGDDRIFGGAGEDGILGDDGRVLTSRNGLTESLYGIHTPSVQAAVNLPGTQIGALTNITGRLKKSVDLAAYYVGGNDIVYGGLGDDFIHGGAGDDAISGAEATSVWFITTAQTGPSILAYNAAARKFAAYNAVDALSKMNGFVLNFDATTTSGAKINDGMDNIFGDEGNDWIVGGTMNDRLFGGMGDDLLNADDNLETNGGLNNMPDAPLYADADWVFGGGGLDVLIGNTGADRLFDWVKHLNTYVVPIMATTAGSGLAAPTVLRDPNSQITSLLLALGNSGGNDADTDVIANQFYAELGLVTIEDGQTWQDQVQLSLGRDPAPINLIAGLDTLGGFETLPSAGIRISESSATVSEYGTTKAVNVSLTSPPTQNVVLSIVSQNTAEVRVGTSTLTFTPLNWSIPQSVMVTGVDDTIVDGHKTANVTISVNTALSASAYAAVTSQTVAVTNNDNELSRSTINGPTAVTASQRPAITWSNDPGAAGHDIFINNVTTGVNAYLVTTSATNSFVPTADLGIGVFDVWVRSFRSDGIKGIWSPARRFTINTPVEIDTLTPLQTSPVPTITWTPIAGAVQYDIWINNVSTGQSQFVRDANITSASWTAATDMPIAAYRVWIRAIYVTGTAAQWSRAVDFQISLPVVLNAPAAVQSTARPTITWSPLAGAVRYDVWINNQTTGQSQVVRETNVTATTWMPPADLPLASYRMWVRGIDASGRFGQWSALAEFRIAAAPTPVGPLNSTFDQTPTFSWTAVAGAATYTFQLRNMETGATVQIEQDLTTTSFTVPTDLPNGNYRWWSAAFGVNSQPAVWSSPTDFSIGGWASFTQTAGTFGTTPTFNWLAVDGAARYEIQINRIDIVQFNVVRESNLTGTSFTVPNPLVAGGTYRIWIRAIGVGGQLGKWSSTLEFTVAASNTVNDPASIDLASLDLLDNLLVELLNDQTPTDIKINAETATEEHNRSNRSAVVESATATNTDMISDATLTEIDDIINSIVTDLLISEEWS
jgi:Ca2+-binding RTX toxin-like protein